MSFHLRYRTRLTIAFALTALLLASVAIVTHRAFQAQDELEAQVTSSWHILGLVDSVLTRIVDAETGERGYVLTGQESFLEPYYNAIVRVREAVAALQAVTLDEPGQSALAADLAADVDVALAFFSRVLRTYLEVGAEPARSLIATGEGKARTDRIRATAAAIVAGEQARLAVRQQEAHRAGQVAWRATMSALLVTALILVGVGWLVFHEHRRRSQTESELVGTNAELQQALERLHDLERLRAARARLVDRLHGSMTRTEALAAIEATIADVVPHESGALSLIAASRNHVETLAHWGRRSVSQEIFLPESCWALRRGRPHVSSAGTPRCAHLAVDVGGETLCVPLVAHGETLGVLQLVEIARPTSGLDIESEMQTLPEQLSMALANIELRDSLRHQSLRDPLTGLFNRRYLDAALDRELSRARRRGGNVSVVLCDLDHFKRLNDTCGHDIGDTVLVAVAEVLRGNSRGEDIPSRHGGEEFLVLLPDTEPEVALRRAEEIRQAVAKLSPPQVEAAGLRVTLSAGVAGFPQHAYNGRDLLARADAALYAAKRGGRDRVVAASAGETADVPSAEHSG